MADVAMGYRRLGKAGLKVSELSLGSWVTFGGQVGLEPAAKCLRAAYDLGINFFDGAEGYARGQAEDVMGQVIRDAKWRRESLVLSTKVFYGGEGPNDTGLSHKHVIEAVNAALRRLRVDYVDLAYCHRPDPNTPIEETVRAFDILVKQGKVFYWGTSEWSAAQVEEAFTVAKSLGLTPPSMEQPQYSLFMRKRVEDEYAPLYAKHGYGTTTWSPLASGVLSGKYQKAIPQGSRLAMPDYQWLQKRVATPAHLASVERLTPIAKELDCTLAQLALAWCLKNPHVSSVITGATRPEQVQENVKALVVVPKLSAEVLQHIEAAIDPSVRG